MLSGFQNASRVPELRRRVLFTLAMIAVYRLGVHVPTPGIDRQAMAAFFDQQKNTLFGFLNLFSGGALEQLNRLTGSSALDQQHAEQVERAGVTGVAGNGGAVGGLGLTEPAGAVVVDRGLQGVGRAHLSRRANILPV